LTVLRAEALHEKFYLWASERKRHVMENEVPTAPHLDEVARSYKLLNLCGRSKKREVMLLRTFIGSGYGGLGAPKRLPVELANPRRQNNEQSRQ
jgi:hypothetical protein